MNERLGNFDDVLMGVDSKVEILGGVKIRAINFDNAATTPPFKSVLNSIYDLSKYYGSIGRGRGQKSEFTSKIYADTKKYLMDFFNIKDKDKYTVLYVNNTTDGMNTLARILIKDRNEVVISTRMEHHSNDLPWRRHCKVDYIEVDDLGRLKIDELEHKLRRYKGKVKYITVTGASNVTGYMNDIHRLASIAHKYNAKIIVDGAQLVPHIKVDMTGNSEEESIDFLVFSGHKLYAPFGSGVIIGLKEDFNKNLPSNEGGGTVNIVLDKTVEYLYPPEKDEAGTPNFFGAVAVTKALEELQNIGFDKIRANEKCLRDRLLSGLFSIPGVKTYGDIINREDRLGIGVFNIDSINHSEVAEELAKRYGIAVRQGWFCAHPYCRRLMKVSEEDTLNSMNDKNKGMPGMIRVSFGIYNEKSEVDDFLNAVEDISLKNKKAK